MLTLSALLPWIDALAMIALPLIGAAVVRRMRSKQVDEVLVQAIERAGGAAYASLLASGRGPTDARALQLAASEGALYMVDRVGDAMREKGISPEGAEQIVKAQLGKLMAADVNVKL